MPSDTIAARLRNASLTRGVAGVALAAGLACVFTPPPPLPEELAAKEQAKQARVAAVRGGGADPAAGETDGAAGEETDAEPMEFEPGAPPPLGMNAAQMKAYAAAQGDPVAGAFSLDEALTGLPTQGELWAQLETPRGVIACRLLEDEAPLTVANFVGLARGLRPSRGADGGWKKRRYYDGTIFHRVIPGFMIQGGDPSGTGRGNAGYVILDELRPELRHDVPGILSMANRGAGTGSAQFFITLGPAPHLDGKHTVFGKCTEEAIRIADDIALVPRGPDDKPTDDEVLRRVVITRQPKS